LKAAVERVRALAEKHGESVRAELNASEKDERVIEERNAPHHGEALRIALRCQHPPSTVGTVLSAGRASLATA
jgi:hypothetical protein